MGSSYMFAGLCWQPCAGSKVLSAGCLSLGERVVL